LRRRSSEGLDAEFSAFVHRRARHHLRTAVLLTGDWHTAEDLVQTCLVKLYRAWPRLDTGVDPDAYLRRMLINTHRSWWRARWRREAPVASIPDRAGEADGQDRHAVAETVRQALGALPARQRAALVLPSSRTCPRRRSPTCWAARSGRSRPTPTAASAGSASSWAPSSSPRTRDRSWTGCQRTTRSVA